MPDAAATLYGPAASPEAPGAAVAPVASPTTPAAPAKPSAASGAPREAALYSDLKSATPPAPPAQIKPTTAQEATDALYGEKPPEFVPVVPDNIKALREADVDRKLYSAQGAFKSALPDSVFEHVEGVKDSAKAVVAAELREIARDLGAEVQDVKEIVALANQVRVNPPNAKMTAEWQATAAERLIEQFGPNASKALDAAKALVARDPRLVRLLDTTGLGNHPDVVLKLVRLAQK